jgi:hypothetical protein
MRVIVSGIGSAFRAHWKGLLLFPLAVVVVILTVNLAYYGLSRQAKSCTVCHYMQPYYDQWASSTHNEVTCVRCHPYSLTFFTVITLKYWTGTYNPRPRAEVDDATCLQSGCHDMQLLQPSLVFAEDIAFSHEDHLGELRRGKKLRCTSCHSRIVQGEHIAVTERVCFLCHFKGAKVGQSITGCPSCHGTPKQIVEHEGFSFAHGTYIDVGVSCDQCHIEVTRGDGAVPMSRCHDCHVERVERYEDSKFIHDVHVETHAIDCFKCHDDINHGAVQMIRALEVKCENCHQSLHSTEKQMYMGVGGKGTADTPSRMFSAQVACDGCHTQLVADGGVTFTQSNREAQRRSCLSCHGTGYDRMLDDWISISSKMLKQLKPSLDRARKAVERARQQGRTLRKQEEWLDEAEYNYNFVARGRAAHNVEYAVKLMKVAAQRVDQIFNSLRVPARVPKGKLLGTPDGYCTVLCHSRLGLPDTVKYELMEFPHDLHARDIEIACTTCHSPEKHKMQIITVSECMSCHHEEQDIDCGHCHPAQKALYTGQVEASGVEALPDIMAEAEVECVGCHDLTAEGPTFERVEEACNDCHGEGYREMLVEWYNSLQESSTRVILLLNQIEEALNEVPPGTPKAAQVKRLFEEARQNYQIVDKGKGTHNPTLSEELLQAAEERLLEARELLGLGDETEAPELGSR